MRWNYEIWLKIICTHDMKLVVMMCDAAVVTSMILERIVVLSWGLMHMCVCLSSISSLPGKKSIYVFLLAIVRYYWAVWLRPKSYWPFICLLLTDCPPNLFIIALFSVAYNLALQGLEQWAPATVSSQTTRRFYLYLPRHLAIHHQLDLT